MTQLDRQIVDNAIAGQEMPPQAQQQLEVNVCISNHHLDGAPVVVERNPTYPNLVGTIEQEMTMGALTTDHTLLQAGAML